MLVTNEIQSAEIRSALTILTEFCRMADDIGVSSRVLDQMDISDAGFIEALLAVEQLIA